MKRIALVASLALAAIPSPASAQVGFGLSAGLAMPQSDFSQGFDNGYHVQGSLNIAPPLSPVGFRIDGTYDHFNLKPLTSPGGTVPTGSAAISGVSGDVVYGLGGLIVGPYLLGGVGYYQTSITYNAASVSNRTAGFNGGVGMKFGLGSMAASVEARYFFVNGSNNSNNSTFIPITFGISF